MFPTSQIELSRSALRHNLRFLKKEIGPHVRLCSVIKGNAYGHSIHHFLPMAEACGVDHFAVFGADEAATAHACRKNETTHISIMGAMDDAAVEWAVEQGLSFWVFDQQRLHHATQTARRIGKPARIHLELETGLNRTGLEPDDLEVAAEHIRSHADVLQVEGVCTHFAGAEHVSNYLRIQNQAKLFQERVSRLAQLDVQPGMCHVASSAAAFAYPDTHMDMVRFGIMQYGFWPSQEVHVQYCLQKSASGQLTDPLRRVMRWVSRVMSVKDVSAGQFVGYGTSFMTTRPLRLATIPVGYFHGYARNLSNMGHVLIRGKRAGVVGLVNMNMMMVDVTNLPGIQRGEEVVIIGKQKRDQITVAAFSQMIRNLDYETLVRLPSEIPRVVVR